MYFKREDQQKEPPSKVIPRQLVINFITSQKPRACDFWVRLLATHALQELCGELGPDGFSAELVCFNKPKLNEKFSSWLTALGEKEILITPFLALCNIDEDES